MYQFGGRTFLQPSPVEFGYIRAGGGGGDAPAAAAGEERRVPLKAVGLAAGEGVSGVLDASGALFTWGKNLHTGMLGHAGYSLGTNQPVRVEALAAAGAVRFASFGSKHAAAVMGPAPVA